MRRTVRGPPPVAGRAAGRDRLDRRDGRARRRDLPGQLDRLVRHRLRLETPLPARRARPARAADHRPATQPVVLPRRVFTVPHRTVVAPPVPVVALAVAAAGPTGVVLLGHGRRRAAPAAVPARSCCSARRSLWWAFLPALVGLAWFGISRRDWRAAAIGAGVLAGIGPWFYYELQEPHDVLLLRAARRTVPGPGRHLRARRAHHRPRRSAAVRRPRSAPFPCPRTVGCTGPCSPPRSSCWSRCASGGTTRSTPACRSRRTDWARHMLLGNRWV